MCWLYSELLLKIFGCICFIHISQIFRSKLDPMAEKCVFVGYAPEQKGYKCFNPLTKKIHISMDVSFIENQPYFTKNHLQGENIVEEDNFLQISKPVEKNNFLKISKSLPNTFDMIDTPLHSDKRSKETGSV